MGKSAPVPPAPDPFFGRGILKTDNRREPEPDYAPRPSFKFEEKPDEYLKSRERGFWLQMTGLAFAIAVTAVAALYLLRKEVWTAFFTGSSF